jgi:uncharacterized protein (DUF58 family)
VTLTWSGRVLAGASALVVACGIIVDYPELVAVGLAGVAAVAAGIVTVTWRPAVVVDRVVHPSRVTEGHQVGCVLTVTNHGRRRSPPCELVEVVAGEAVTVPLPPIEPRVTNAVGRYGLPAPRRGIYELPPLRVRRIDSLRLAERTSAGGAATTYYVHPRRFPLVSPDVFGAADIESWQAHAHQGDASFHSLREYVPGDDLRRVHWPSSARTGQLVVRHTFVPARRGQVIVLDVAAAGYHGDTFEDAVRIVASLAEAVGGDGAPFDLLTNDRKRPSIALGGPDTVPTALDFLAGVSTVSSAEQLLGWPELVAASVDGRPWAVVTGRLDGAGMATLRQAGTVVGKATIIQVRPDGATGTRPGGTTRTLTVRSAAEFAARWNGPGR